MCPISSPKGIFVLLITAGGNTGQLVSPPNNHGAKQDIPRILNCFRDFSKVLLIVPPMGILIVFLRQFHKGTTVKSKEALELVVDEVAVTISGNMILAGEFFRAVQDKLPHRFAELAHRPARCRASRYRPSIASARSPSRQSPAELVSGGHRAIRSDDTRGRRDDITDQ